MNARGGGRSREESDRRSYLEQLLNEFKETTSLEAKYQVLANLSNFAYDPVNYEYLRQIGALDTFVKELQNSDETLVHFACCAICNLCLDPINARFILGNNGIDLLINLLSSNREEIKLNAITSLIFLCDSDDSIANNTNIIKHITELKDSSDSRFANLAKLFLNSRTSDEDKPSSQ